EKHTEKHSQKPAHHGKPQGRRRERGNALERKIEQAQAVPFGGPGYARHTVVLNNRCRQSYPCKQPFHVSVPLFELPQCINRFTAHQSKITGIRRYVDITDHIEQSVEMVCTAALEPRFT